MTPQPPDNSGDMPDNSSHYNETTCDCPAGTDWARLELPRPLPSCDDLPRSPFDCPDCGTNLAEMKGSEGQLFLCPDCFLTGESSSIFRRVDLEAYYSTRCDCPPRPLPDDDDGEDITP